MANSNTFGILEKNWNIKDYLNRFVDINEKSVFLSHVGESVLNLRKEFEIDFKKAQIEHYEYLNNSFEPDFKQKEFDIKSKNFSRWIIEWKKNKSKTDSDLAKYMSMYQQVKDLNLVANKELRDLMLDEIKKSIVFDCRYSKKPKVGSDYNVDDFILWKINYLWLSKSNILINYNRNRAKLLREKYKAIELLEVFAKL